MRNRHRFSYTKTPSRVSQPLNIFLFVQQFTAKLESFHLAGFATDQYRRQRIVDILGDMPLLNVAYIEKEYCYTNPIPPIALTNDLVSRIFCNKRKSIDIFVPYVCTWPTDVLCRFVGQWREHTSPLDYFNARIPLTRHASLTNFEIECRRQQLPYAYATWIRHDGSQNPSTTRFYRIRHQHSKHLYIVIGDHQGHSELFIRRSRPSIETTRINDDGALF